MAHGLNSIIKREIDCGHHNSIGVINKSSNMVGNSATATAAAVQASASGASGPASHSGAGNARMGSRRIFTPQFKLQVLDSFRNDSECKGNQRATARKYGIHRRQIQKWLQCEENLRASVANYNQNNVKHHQFHNITHHPMTVSPPSAAIGAASTAAATTPAPAIAQAVGTHTASGAYVHNNNNNNNLHHHRHNQPHQPHKTALDAARHSVALASSPPTAAPATIRLSAAAAVAPTKCMNGSALIQPTGPTNTMALHPAYSQAPAIKPVPLIQPHHQHQSPLHQHHQLHHPQRQHESILMPSACLPELPIAPASGTHELVEYPPMNRYENLHRPQAQHAYEYIRLFPVAPIDLSSGPRRLLQPAEQKEVAYFHPPGVGAEAKWYEPPETNNNEQGLKVKAESYPVADLPAPSPSQAVDLTCRKRLSEAPLPNSPPKKIKKVEAEEGGKVPAKPVKLFKPYLPDNEDPVEVEKEQPNEQKDAIIWSNHPAASLASPSHDTQSTRSSNFQSPPIDPAYPFPLGSPSSTTEAKFQSSPASSLYDRITPPAITAATPPSTLMWCSKGSPVSGYDTASTYSDSSEPHQPGGQQLSPAYNHSPPTTSYSLDVKVEPLDGGYYHDLTRCQDERQQSTPAKYPEQHHHEVRRWLLDQHTTSTRPGIAVYV